MISDDYKSDSRERVALYLCIARKIVWDSHRGWTDLKKERT